MKQEFNLGDKVIVNTGGNDSIAIIDYPKIRKDMYGRERSFKMTVHGETAYLCRFTDDITKCWIGGAIRTNDARKQMLRENAQFIPEEFIKPV